jgi:hypothetical protein
MNRTLLALSLLCIVIFASCKKATVTPPPPSPKGFKLASDTVYQYQFISPIVINPTDSVQTKKETYQWDWGDKTADTGQHATHQYLTGGNFTIKLTTIGGSVSQSVFVYPGTGIVQITNGFTEPLTKMMITSNKGGVIYPVGTLLPGQKTNSIMLDLLPEYGPCTISGYVGDTTQKTVFFQWKENYLPTDGHAIFTITGQSTVYFLNTYGYWQDTWLSEWTKFNF